MLREETFFQKKWSLIFSFTHGTNASWYINRINQNSNYVVSNHWVQNFPKLGNSKILQISSADDFSNKFFSDKVEIIHKKFKYESLIQIQLLFSSSYKYFLDYFNIKIDLIDWHWARKSSKFFYSFLVLKICQTSYVPNKKYYHQRWLTSSNHSYKIWAAKGTFILCKKI